VCCISKYGILKLAIGKWRDKKDGSEEEEMSRWVRNAEGGSRDGWGKGEGGRGREREGVGIFNNDRPRSG
jgi:hypothetical protein